MRLRWRLPLAFVVATALLAGIVTFASQSQLLENYMAKPVLWVIPILAAASISMTYIFNKKGEPGKAFIASSLSIAGLMGIVGSALFPNLVPASNNPNLSLTLSNASSSELTLKTMLIIALVGMPLVLIYTLWIYHTFRGKVLQEEDGY